jgi:hypothetical protein
MTTTTADADTTARTTPPHAAPDASTSEQTEELAIRWLAAVVLHGKPRRAIAAFRALTRLCEFYRETHARIVELSRTGRPAIAAAAAGALVEARLARLRYRDGRSPLLRP